jgi:hypothetical protein
MTTHTKKLLIQSLPLPCDVTGLIKDFLFPRIKKIDASDDRYNILSQIPTKEYSPEDDVTFVYLYISEQKDYFLTYCRFQIQLQTLVYGEDNTVYGVEAHSVAIPSTF